MTEQLYRWVKATDALPPAGSEVKMKWDDGDKEWYGDPVTELRDVRKQYYHKLLWQQPIPSPVSGILLESAQDYADKIVPVMGVKHDRIITTREAVREDVQNAFLAGAAYVKPDIDKVVEQMREANPYYESPSQSRDSDSKSKAWFECCDKLSELLNKSK